MRAQFGSRFGACRLATCGRRLALNSRVRRLKRSRVVRAHNAGDGRHATPEHASNTDAMRLAQPSADVAA
jgi:hypothetical protein